jgi:hypothetical protein
MHHVTINQKISKNGRPEEANFVKKQVSQLNFQRTEILTTTPSPNPILYIRWAREANDADHKEGAPVDWGLGGHGVNQHEYKVGRVGVPF